MTRHTTRENTMDLAPPDGKLPVAAVGIDLEHISKRFGDTFTREVCTSSSSPLAFVFGLRARPVRGTVTDTICVADKPVTRTVADDLPGAFFDRGAFPGTLVKVEQRRIG